MICVIVWIMDEYVLYLKFGGIVICAIISQCDYGVTTYLVNPGNCKFNGLWQT